MKSKNLICLFALVLLLFNCSSGGDDPAMEPNPDPSSTGKVTYNADIKSIISSNCTSCHSNPPANGAPMSLTTYSQVKSYINTIISRVNSSSNPMPPSPNSPLSATEKNLLQQWKNDGLLEK